MRDFCAGHACSPGSSGRQWQGGSGHTFGGVAIFADVLGILGICFAQTWTARARVSYAA